MNPYEPPVPVEEPIKPYKIGFWHKLYLRIFNQKKYCKIFGHNWDEDQGWHKTKCLWNCYTCGAKQIDCG